MSAKHEDMVSITSVIHLGVFVFKAIETGQHRPLTHKQSTA
jgi:hypothetical protein